MNNQNVINFKLKKVISELESIEHLDFRLSNTINFIAKILKDYPTIDEKQLNFLVKVSNDSKQIKL